MMRSLLLSVLFAFPATAQEKDWAEVPLKELGIEPFKAKKDEKTGFVVGGKNETALLRKLTEINGRSLADLEKDMRPGAFSTKGFLGAKEKLLDILAEDNEVVLGKLGQTHQDLARHLQILGAVAQKKKSETIVYRGRKLALQVVVFRGFAQSPFLDGTKTNMEVTATNEASKKKLTYSLLIPPMVERYGFYEGHGTPYRVEPARIVEVLELK
ncbi:MAG: hypothetical protein U0793_34510 [Gemmataceae bacterium]